MTSDIDALLADFRADFFGRLVAESMTDEEMFAGLDTKTIAYLRSHLEKTPGLRATLCQAARYRATHIRQARRSAEFVYFIEATTSGLIKIGSASDAGRRLATLQTGSPEPLRLLATTPGGEALERELHAQFAADRSHGEWFRPSARLMDLIGGLK